MIVTAAEKYPSVAELKRRNPQLWGIFQVILGEIGQALESEVALSEGEAGPYIYLGQTSTWPAFVIAHINPLGKHPLQLPHMRVKADVISTQDVKALDRFVAPWRDYPIGEDSRWQLGISQPFPGILAKGNLDPLTLLRSIQVIATLT